MLEEQRRHRERWRLSGRDGLFCAANIVLSLSIRDDCLLGGRRFVCDVGFVAVVVRTNPAFHMTWCTAQMEANDQSYAKPILEISIAIGEKNDSKRMRPDQTAAMARCSVARQRVIGTELVLERSWPSRYLDPIVIETIGAV
jgi:hypothetical protein